MPKKHAPLPRATIQVDDRGRITIPDYLRDAADTGPGTWVEIEAYPELKDGKCKGLMLRRSF